MSGISFAMIQLLEGIKKEAEPPIPLPKPPVKDYSKFNKQRVKEIQSKLAKPTTEEKPKPKKYASVPSRFRDVKTEIAPQNNTTKVQLPKTKPKLDIPMKSYRAGKIPNYLIARKQQWVEEEKERIRNTPDPSIPAGHSLMPDEERVETLELLKKNQIELLYKIGGLPLTVNTLKMKSYRENLEAQLAKIDEGIDIFSRQKVLIKNDV